MALVNLDQDFRLTAMPSRVVQDIKDLSQVVSRLLVFLVFLYILAA
jgi:hypothetical protein